MRPTISYLVCATPRSGSTLLCEALANTGIAGQPDEYFEALQKTGLPRRPREYFEDLGNSSIAEQLGEYSRVDDEPAPWSLRGVENYVDYLARTMEIGTTPNGVFGAKVMWGYFDDFIAHLRQIPAYREMVVADLLATVFPNLHYIYVTRNDKVRQAVSLWKAIQTSTWKAEPSTDKGKHPRKELVFRFDALDHLIRQIEAHEMAWRQYFATHRIHPFTVEYEEFVGAYEGCTLKMLRYLQIPIPENQVFKERRMKRQSDGQSEEWVQQYCALKQE